MEFRVVPLIEVVVESCVPLSDVLNRWLNFLVNGQSHGNNIFLVDFLKELFEFVRILGQRRHFLALIFENFEVEFLVEWLEVDGLEELFLVVDVKTLNLPDN